MSSGIKCGTCGEVEPEKWISVKDDTPVINETVIISDGFEVFTGFYSSMHEWHMQNTELCKNVDFDVFYWMPLPEPPNE